MHSRELWKAGSKEAQSSKEAHSSKEALLWRYQRLDRLQLI
jgi:hypothetical protein